MKKEFEVICKNCGKKFIVIEEETKEKISKTINQGILNHKYKLKNQYGEYVYGIRKCICEYCGKEFENHKNKRFCSNECKYKSAGEKISKLRKQEIENGTFQGWKSRNIISYAEKFWKNVLDNNNIPYQREYLFSYGDIKNGERYFLDFYIEINGRKIDLEIDGKQHKYLDRIEKDNIRDKFIKECGIEVYRISWNEINSIEGSLLMKEKINKFLIFINQNSLLYNRVTSND